MRLFRSLPRNRLRLDFSLETAEERLNFLNSYLPTITFELDEHETETLSDYILWGKNKEGLNIQQEGIATLKEWAPGAQTESLDGLMEIPGFQESKLQKIGGTHYKTKRIVFDREDALKKAPAHLIPVFQNLFQQIDETELLINFYELRIGKRKNPPRQPLLNRFEEEEILELEKKAEKVTPRKYLQLRHFLVELRTEQYTYYDSVATSIMPHAETHVDFEDGNLQFGEDFPVRPFGLLNNSTLAQKIFIWPPDPYIYTEDELKQISELIWKEAPKDALNFENPEHILALYKNYNELLDEVDKDPDQIYGAAASIIQTLKFYESIAKLSDLQRELLQMKIENLSNNQIKDILNQKYGTTYNDNYISTIYRQKILPSIAEAATYHKQVMENIFYPENFKRCKDCGRLLLRSPDFFMRQKKATDGFAPRCKQCQKIKREERKLG